MTVLIADDDAGTRRLMRRMLECLGYSCVAVAGARALERLGETKRPDAVVSDVNLGDGDGVEVCSALRRRYPGLPVVIVTADPASAERARESGFKEILDKPFRQEDLAGALRRALDSEGGA